MGIEIKLPVILSKLGIPNYKVDIPILTQALTHKSVQIDRVYQILPHNERLEYLGDAILKSSVSEWLFKYFPDTSEGRMSQIRSYVVSDAALSKAALRIGLQEHIILGESEKASKGHLRESILANVFEAICGAVFLSSNYKDTANMILPLLKIELELALAGDAQEVLNYKAMFQEYAQAEFKCLPSYHLTSTEGPDHQRIFNVEVTLNEKILGKGSGLSKKKAEQEAAYKSLTELSQLEAGKLEPLSIPAEAQRYLEPSSTVFEKNTKEAPFLLTPSILSADFAQLPNVFKQLEEGGADWIHLDVMDGHFVPNLTFGPPFIKSIRPLSTLPFDAHLMISNPEHYIEDYVKAGCDRISVHAEACVHLDRVIEQIRLAGAEAGVVLNPATPLSAIEHILSKVSLVLLMSVNPGFGGQSFIPEVLNKTKQLKNLLKKKGLNQVLIQIDGGVNHETLPQIIEAGADVIVIGSAIFKQANTKQATQKFKNWRAA